MNYEDGRRRLEALRARVRALQDEMRAIETARDPEPIADYRFDSTAGPVSLAALFGRHDTLFVVHNMGRGCVYCTLWADELNGVLEHLSSRAAFVLSTPDAPDVQRDFAAERGWRMPMVSCAATTFAADMGYRRDGAWWPGVSVFRKTPTGIVRVSDAEFGPGDAFCSVWHLFDLMPEGAAGWQPKYRYPS